LAPWEADGGVVRSHIEPVSTCDSLPTGKLTGNFVIPAVLDAIFQPKARVPQ
jgi:hypothetical protein